MMFARWYVLFALVGLGVGCSKTEVAEGEGAAAKNVRPQVARENPNDPSGGGEDGDTFKVQPVVNAPAAKLPVTPSSPPEEVVTEFLNALKSGNDGVTAGLLTTKAREETAKFQLAVQPPGTPSAIYQVSAGEVSSDDPTMAQVACLWTEKDEAGVEHSDEVVWVLHQETEGWRVCGMAAQMPGRNDPVFFDFEDPAEMIRVSSELQGESEASATVSAEQPVGGSEIREAKNIDEVPNSLRNR